VKKVVIIPARMESSRFPGKALVDIDGLPMVVRVAHQAKMIDGISDVLIATDSSEIISIAQQHGVFAVMTGRCESGTDRVAEVVRLIGLGDDDLILNLQGDMPYVSPQVCEELFSRMDKTPWPDAVTPVEELFLDEDINMFTDPNAVKAIIDLGGRALYFTRLQALAGEKNGRAFWYRHVGMYGYRRPVLEFMERTHCTPLEKIERLEQLRLLEHGFHIQTFVASESCGPDINCPEDLERLKTWEPQ